MCKSTIIPFLGMRGFVKAFKLVSFELIDIVVFTSTGCAKQGLVIMLPIRAINIHFIDPVNKFLLIAHIMKQQTRRCFKQKYTQF